MTIKTIINYRSRGTIVIHVIWMFLDQNPLDEDEAYNLQRSNTQSLPPYDADHDLHTLKGGQGIFGSLSIFRGGRRLTKTMKT